VKLCLRLVTKGIRKNASYVCSTFEEHFVICRVQILAELQFSSSILQMKTKLTVSTEYIIAWLDVLCC